eukprot:TRINITY_DN28374_c0_g1_i2.p1 TRINITY_DN28374_c0_g1~~TRINITY_DN28374_c0_g1_i2.p1  ORF type:complete len:857 (+),score=312.52 TRINITY_DN28374_c0_g1_i2:69-2573(+)
MLSVRVCARAAALEPPPPRGAAVQWRLRTKRGWSQSAVGVATGAAPIEWADYLMATGGGGDVKIRVQVLVDGAAVAQTRTLSFGRSQRPTGAGSFVLSGARGAEVGSVSLSWEMSAPGADDSRMAAAAALHLSAAPTALLPICKFARGDGMQGLLAAAVFVVELLTWVVPQRSLGALLCTLALLCADPALIDSACVSVAPPAFVLASLLLWSWRSSPSAAAAARSAAYVRREPDGVLGKLCRLHELAGGGTDGRLRAAVYLVGAVATALTPPDTPAASLRAGAAAAAALAVAVCGALPMVPLCVAAALLLYPLGAGYRTLQWRHPAAAALLQPLSFPGEVVRWDGLAEPPGTGMTTMEPGTPAGLSPPSPASPVLPPALPRFVSTETRGRRRRAEEEDDEVMSPGRLDTDSDGSGLAALPRPQPGIPRLQLAGLPAGGAESGGSGRRSEQHSARLRRRSKDLRWAKQDARARPLYCGVLLPAPKGAFKELKALQELKLAAQDKGEVAWNEITRAVCSLLLTLIDAAEDASARLKPLRLFFATPDFLTDLAAHDTHIDLDVDCTEYRTAQMLTDDQSKPRPAPRSQRCPRGAVFERDVQELRKSCEYLLPVLPSAQRPSRRLHPVGAEVDRDREVVVSLCYLAVELFSQRTTFAFKLPPVHANGTGQLLFLTRLRPRWEHVAGEMSNVPESYRPQMQSVPQMLRRQVVMGTLDFPAFGETIAGLRRQVSVQRHHFHTRPDVMSFRDEPEELGLQAPADETVDDDDGGVGGGWRETAARAGIGTPTTSGTAIAGVTREDRTASAVSMSGLLRRKSMRSRQRSPLLPAAAGGCPTES